MKENVLDVLLYLFENYMIEGAEFEPDHESLSIELAQAGFGDGEIDKAFHWLEDLSDMCERPAEPAEASRASSVRHFSSEEVGRLDSEARGFLLGLEQRGVVDPSTRELIIDRVMALETDEIDLEHLKWVTMMVLCNQPAREDIGWTEDFVIDGVDARLH